MTLTKPRSAFLACVTTILITGVALAGIEDLTSRAEQLSDDYGALEGRIDQDEEAHLVLRAEYDGLEVERLLLDADRAEHGGDCDCPDLDELLGELDELSGALDRKMGGWEEND